MDDLIMELENDPILSKLLTVNRSLGSDSANRNEWKKMIDNALEDFDKTEQIKVFKWCISKLEHNLRLHLENPLGRHTLNLGNLQMDIWRTEDIQRENNFISAGYNFCIRHFEKRYSLATGRNRYRLNRIKWLASQQELAELFIQLRQKGWIENVNAESIKECFENTDSLQQILKPGKHTEKWGGTFSQVFTKSYVPIFENLPPNLKKE